MINIYRPNYFNHTFCMQPQESEKLQKRFQKLTFAIQKTKTHNLRIARFNHNFRISTERKYQSLKNYAAKFRIAQHWFQRIYT